MVQKNLSILELYTYNITTDICNSVIFNSSFATQLSLFYEINLVMFLPSFPLQFENQPFMFSSFVGRSVRTDKHYLVLIMMADMSRLPEDLLNNSRACNSEFDWQNKLLLQCKTLLS